MSLVIYDPVPMMPTARTLLALLPLAALVFTAFALRPSSQDTRQAIIRAAITVAAVTVIVNPAPIQPGVQDGNSHGCLLGGAITSVLHHLELARHGMDEDLLDSLAMDLQGLKGHSA